jgi:hypothetical protein
MQYEFNIGDEVITTDGVRGVIVDICYCAECMARGFHELVWEDEDGNKEWITNLDRRWGFNSFYKIGNYKFAALDRAHVVSQIAAHEKIIAEYKKQLALIDELIWEEEKNKE